MTGAATAQIGPDGLLRFQGGIYRCAIGKGGIRTDKREGDGATPTAVSAAPIAPDDGWCDDPGHAAYNTQIRLPHPARHEELWRADAIYDLIGVLGWNDMPVVRGRGSAIFLHLARPGFTPTEGCIALEQRDLLRVLADGLSAIEVLA